MKESFPSNKNYELQQAYLKQKQADISQKLFEAGVSPRILEVQEGHGAKIASRGLDMLNVQCFPVRKKRLTDSGDELTVMNLCVKQEDTEQSAASYKYIPVGTLDRSGVIIYPSEGVISEDAEAVLMAGLDLATARDSGELPDLDWSLQSIRNPNTAIKKA